MSSLPQDAASYEALRAGFRWRVPERFNIGVDVCDRWAEREPGRLALTFVEEGGAVRDYGFGELRSYKLGAVAVPLFTLFGPDALEYRLGNSGARAVITNREGAAKLLPIRPRLPELGLVLAVDGAAPGTEALHQALARESDSFAPADTRADDPAVIIYTSGTTGQPKGALHGHRVLLGHLPGVEMSHDLLPQAGDRIWTPADWAWIGGLLDVLLPALHHGVPVVARRFAKFTGEAAFELLQSQAVRNAFIPPTALKMMRAVPERAWRLGLRSVASGGETLGAELLDWGRRVLGVTINEFYGQTECNMVVSSCARLMAARPGLMGRAVPGHEVEIVDEAGRVLPAGQLGAVAVRRPDPVMFLEYWRNPEATRAKFRGDWLLTGDSGMRDEQGWLRFVGRDDDVITSAGYRIGPGEIEDCLIRHPAVRMAAVVGKPDPTRTEIVKAYLVLRDGVAASAALAAEIQAFVRTNLAAHEYPREVAFVDSLPMTTTGKIIRRALRDRARAEAAGS